MQSTKAKLLATPAFNGTTVTLLEKGAELQFIEEQKRWVKVAFDDHEGWVSVLFVKSTPPLDKLKVISSEAVTLEGDARKRASAVATAGASRGLTDGEDGTDQLQSDYDELELMESVTLSPSDLDEFGSPLN